MANDKNGLYLPLKINLSEWEKSLTQADADLQKAMRDMKGAVTDLKFKYDVDISSAKAVGNMTKALELENKKLNQVYLVQKQAMEALNRAYEQSVKDKGADARETQNLAKQLVYQTREMEKAKRQLDAVGLNFGKKLSDGLASASPAFNKVREATKSITGSLSSLGGTATTVATALGGIGIAVASIGAVAGGLDAITNKVNEIAEAGRQASDVVYQLRESAQTSYADAEYIQRVTAVDGSNAEALVNTLVKLDATLMKDKDGTNEATLALQRYGAELFTADGKAKSYKEQLQELSKAAQVASKAGEYAEFKASMPGALRTTEFDHLLLGLENYEKKAKIASSETTVFYDKLHEMSDWQNTATEALRQYNAVKGGYFADSAVENLKNEVDTRKAETILLDRNREALQSSADSVGKLTNRWTDFKGAVRVTWDEWLIGNSKVIDSLLQIKSTWDDIEKSIFGGRPFDLWGDSLDKSAEQLNTVKAQVASARKEIESAKTEAKELPAPKDVKNPKEEAEKQKKYEATLKKQEEAQKRFYKELQDLRSTDYEKEINALNDKKQAWIDANIAITDVEARYAEERALIDKKYYEKKEKERQENLKKQQEAYKKEVEDAKKAQEAQMSEAQNTIKSATKVLNYIQKLKKEGTYSDDAVKQYADKLAMKSSGIKQSQIDTAYEIGIDKLKELMDSNTRLFGKFAGVNNNNNNNNINNLIGFQTGLQSNILQQQQVPVPQAPQVQPQVNVNISFDNIVVEDQGAIQRLADKVADTITPVVEQALRGGESYGY